MKSLIELQQYKKCIISFVVGIVCTLCSLIIYIIDPVKTIVLMNCRMEPNTLIFNLWQKPPVDVFINVYVFNVTNAEAFLKGEEKLKVDEVGPYVYQEVLENHNVTWNENGTISYIPRRTVSFRPDRSVGDPETQFITVPNIPMLGISSALSDAGFFVNYPFVQLANYLGSEPILNMSVYDFLWGYEDSLVALAGTVVPKYINFQKFGLLDRMYDEGVNFINMNVKKSEDMLEEKGRYLSIESFNGSPGLTNWGYVEEEGNETRPENTKCNSIRGSTEGTVFPTELDRRAVFRVFRKAFCRPLPISFVKEVDRHGILGYEYALPEDFADPPESNPENTCYCRTKPCLKKGLMDLTPCYYNIPAAASLPHFLNADQTLLDGVEGLNPDAKKHRTEIILQPTIGIPIYVHSRVQTNLVMQETRYNSKITAFNNLVVPLFWTDLEIPELPDDLSLLIKLATRILPVAQTVLVILLAIGGAAAISWSLARAVVTVQQQQLAGEQQRRDSADLRIPLGNGQYTAIRILPKVKKITSKTDLFM